MPNIGPLLKSLALIGGAVSGNPWGQAAASAGGRFLQSQKQERDLLAEQEQATKEARSNQLLKALTNLKNPAAAQPLIDELTAMGRGAEAQAYKPAAPTTTPAQIGEQFDTATKRLSLIPESGIMGALARQQIGRDVVREPALEMTRPSYISGGGAYEEPQFADRPQIMKGIAKDTVISQAPDKQQPFGFEVPPGAIGAARTLRGAREGQQALQAAQLAQTQANTQKTLAGMNKPPTDKLRTGSKVFIDALGFAEQQLQSGGFTPSQAVQSIERKMKVAGEELLPEDRSQLKTEFASFVLRPLKTLGEETKKKLAGAETIQEVSERALDRLQDPKVQEAIGRMQGAFTRARAWLTGGATMPGEVRDFLSLLGFSVDYISRKQSGAALTADEIAFYEGLMGSDITSVSDIQQRLTSAIGVMEIEKQSIYRNALQTAEGGRLSPETESVLNGLRFQSKYTDPNTQLFTSIPQAPGQAPDVALQGGAPKPAQPGMRGGEFSPEQRWQELNQKAIRAGGMLSPDEAQEFDRLSQQLGKGSVF